MKKTDIKNISLIVLGNIFDYYDFLLFAHLGSVITPFFIQESSSSHLLSLLLFAMPFLSRPIGGYLFGKIADRQSRQLAIQKTIAFASFASLGIAILPSFASFGIMSSWLFFILRSLQGISLGGEYTTAGTLLMEQYKEKQGFISGILGASGTIGSLIAFLFSWIYINGYMTGSSWRIFFILGSLGCFISFNLRKKMGFEKKEKLPHSLFSIQNNKKDVFLVFLIGALVSLLCFIPMVYVNFYMTKIQFNPLNMGLKATFIALSLYIILTPIFGIMSDRIGYYKTMSWGAIFASFFCFLGFYLITQSNLLGQFFLILAASFFSAPIHVVMNTLFPENKKSRSINTFFMLGGSIGGLTPFLSGYIAEHYKMHYTPVILVFIFSMLSFLTLRHCFKNRKNYLDSKYP